MNADVTVREVMDREYVGVSESDDLVETVELLLREEAETAVVLRGSDPVGVLTERDILSLVAAGPEPGEATVSDAMTPSLPTVDPDETLDAAADRMSAQSVRRLVVTNGSEPVGLLTEHDLLASRTHDPTTERGSVRQASVESESAARAVETEAEDAFEDQGICEGCGRLTSDLAAFNGQLLCADCRDI